MSVLLIVRWKQKKGNILIIRHSFWLIRKDKGICRYKYFKSYPLNEERHVGETEHLSKKQGRDVLQWKCQVMQENDSRRKTFQIP